MSHIKIQTPSEDMFLHSPLYRARQFEPNIVLKIIDSGVSIHTMGLSSLTPKERRTIRKSEFILGIQTANGFVEASTKAKVHI